MTLSNRGLNNELMMEIKGKGRIKNIGVIEAEGSSVYFSSGIAIG